jgi:chromosome segregation ATPase
VFRHFPTYRYQTSLALLLTLTLSGCTDDDSQAHLDDMRAALASANAESTALRASGRVLQTRLKATQAELRQRHAQGSQRLRAAESAVAHFRGGLSAASQALSASEFRNTALSQQLAAVSGWLGQRDAVGQSQNNTLKNMEGDLQRSNASLAKLQEQFSAQQQSLHLTTAKAKKSRATNALFAAQLKAIRVQFDELNLRSAQRITALKTQQTQLSRRASNANERAQSSQNSVQRLTKINEQTELELQSLRDDLVSAQDSIGRYRSAKDYLVETIEGQP